MRLYFVRHGESVANTAGIISNRALPHPLTDKGRQQAQGLAQKLRNESVAKIFSSPILRAKQTAEILAQALDVPLEIADALREYDCGTLEGKSISEHEQDYAQLFAAWRAGKWDSRFDGGESLLDIRARFVPFVEQLMRKATVTDTFVLVSHGGTLLSTLPFVLNNINHAFALQQPFENTAVVVAESTPNGLVCHSWCGQAL
jgi:2,3-bisphosphoglycerate-dependent phosphoglycerate mutase